MKKFRQRYRELVNWFAAEQSMDMKALCAYYKGRRDMLLPELKALHMVPAKFESHSIIALWAGVNGVHRRISSANARIVFDDPYVAKFNEGRAPEDQFTRENYERDTPPSTQVSQKARREAKAKAVRKRAAR